MLTKPRACIKIDFFFFFLPYCFFLSLKWSTLSSRHLLADRPSAPAKPLEQVNDMGFLGMSGRSLKQPTLLTWEWSRGLRVVFEKSAAMIINKLLYCASELQFPSTDFF